MGFFSSIQTKYRSFVRYNQIIRIFVRYGFEEFVSYMIASGRYSFIRRLIPQTTRKNAQKYTKWEKLRLVCEELGPTFIKFAQILSNRGDLLPAELIVEFSKLQDNVPPIPGDIARSVVEQELKNSVDEMFEYFEKEAFASASMAQVHKATLKTGEKIVLKIQRPGIRRIIEEDIKVMYTLAEIFEKRIPTLRAFDPQGLVKNFEESITKEMDFIHESINVQRFANNIEQDKDDTTTRTIKVYKQFTTSKVLALEYVQGIKISDQGQMRAKGYDIKLIAHKLAVSYMKQVFEYGFFHADPHPGNILVMKDGEVCFLDFGMMGNILHRDIEILGNLFLSVKARDIKGVVRVLQQMSDNVVIQDKRALEFAINEFIQSYNVQTFHKNEMSTILLELKDIIVQFGLKVPSHFFLLARSMVTIEGVIHNLDRELNLLELARPFIVKAIKRKFNPFTLAKKMLIGLYDLGTYMEDFPTDLKNAIRKINNGQVQVDLTHKGIDPMVHTINRVSRQIVTTLIIVSLAIGSAMFIINDVAPFYRGIPVYSWIGGIIAAYLAWRMIRDFRKGDHDDWKGWNEH